MSLVQRIVVVLWPAFFTAGVLEMGVFAVLDPDHMTWFGSDPIGWSRQAVYTVTFFIFWGAIAAAAGMTAFLMRDGARGRD
jgi:hypothetical protein